LLGIGAQMGDGYSEGQLETRMVGFPRTFVSPLVLNIITYPYV